jgi:hypothetical protein
MNQIQDAIGRVQRELPDTDRTRYDIAYERGRAQARSSLLVGGLAVGSALGAGLMWLLDPVYGAGRRAQLGSRLTGLKNDLSRTAGGRRKDLGNRVEGFAIERGIKQPPSSHESDAATDGSSAYASASSTSPSNGQETITPEEVAAYGSSGPIAGAPANAEAEREEAVRS